MRTGQLSLTVVFAGVLGLSFAGCGNSSDGGAGNGGATGSGGTSETGGSASGGNSGSGGTASSGGSKGSGGTQGSGGAMGGSGGQSSDNTGGTTTMGSGGMEQTGGSAGTSGANTGGRTAATGGRTGGRTGAGGQGTGGSSGGGMTGGGTTGGGNTGTAGAGTGGTTGGKGGSTGTGTCTASKAASQTVSGTGPHKVVIETNSGAGIKCGTIFRPADLGGDEKYPIFVWGEGGCSQNGLSNQAAMGEIASQGYFIVADGTPGGTNACSGGQDGKAFLDYITWAIAENDKPCSAYYQSLDTTKVAADGFSCGGLMSENVSGDARFTAIGITSSGLFSADQALWKKIHTPFKILLGGSSDMAYTNGLRDYDGISALGIPTILFSKDGAGHGGDLGRGTGDFNTINLAWLNWQLKGDTGATGKALLYGPSCKYCTASGWEYKSANIE